MGGETLMLVRQAHNRGSHHLGPFLVRFKLSCVELNKVYDPGLF